MKYRYPNPDQIMWSKAILLPKNNLTILPYKLYQGKTINSCSTKQRFAQRLLLSCSSTSTE
jgi:hypothetical protein